MSCYSETESIVAVFSTIDEDDPTDPGTGLLTGVTIDKYGHIVVVDSNMALVKVFTEQGEFLGSFGRGILKVPWDVFATSSGKLVVSDPGDSDIKVFSSRGKFLTASEAAHHLIKPYGMAYDNVGKEMVVSDRGTSSVYVHDPRGIVTGILKVKDGGKQSFTFPSHVAIDQKNQVYVTDATQNCLYKFDAKHRFEFKYSGSADDALRRPAGVCVDRHGTALVADLDNSRIHLVDARGKFRGFLLTWEDGLTEPLAMTFDNHGHLVVTESSSGLVKVYNYKLLVSKYENLAS